MIFRNLTSTGDWTFGFGKSCYAVARAAIALEIQTRLSSWVGGCFWDLGMGIDWINRLDVNQAVQLKLDLASLISQSYGVVGITQLSWALNSQTRAFVIQYTVDTIYGTNFNNEVTVLLGAQGN